MYTAKIIQNSHLRIFSRVTIQEFSSESPPKTVEQVEALRRVQKSSKQVARMHFMLSEGVSLNMLKDSQDTSQMCVYSII